MSSSLYCCLVREPASAPAPGVLEAVARACSPRVEPHGDDDVVFDASGLTKIFGARADLAAEVCRLAAERGLVARVAVASASTAAWLLAHARAGVTVVAAGREAAEVGALPIRLLDVLPGLNEAPVAAPSRRSRRHGHFRMAPGPPHRAGLALAGLLATLDRWGLRTLGDVARLPRAELRTRFGDLGVRLHQAACGEDPAVLVPAGMARRFVERLELEWPVEGLEPLSFVLARICEALSMALERADRGAVVITTRLALVTRAHHERSLELPAPMRDARVLRTLILLDLETHPPPAGIDAVEVECGVVPGRIVQGSLLTCALPAPEALATLVARLSALMGESRVGAPALADTHDERQFHLQPFAVNRAEGTGPRARCPVPVLRRFRVPIAVRVAAEHGVPVRVIASGGVPGGKVTHAAGPWRSSGRWWTRDRTVWDRDGWDVVVAEGGACRLARDRRTAQWEMEGTFD